MEDKNVTKVVVLGSKPDAPLPLLDAPVVIAANGAIELGRKYRDNFGSYLIGIVPFIELHNHQHICDSFTKAQPDEIVVTGGNEKEVVDFVRNRLKLASAKISILSLHEANWTLASFFGRSRWSLARTFLIKRGIKYFIRFVLLDLIRNRDFVWMHRSTGLNGVLYAAQRFPNLQQIVLGGINAQAGGHFNGVGQFTGKTAQTDQITILHWPDSAKTRVATTEENLSKLAGFSLWQGEVFYHKN
jgi:hypothetical protein